MRTKLEYKGTTLRIEFDYQPFERAERGPEAQYPGCGESAEITEIHIGEVDVTELLEDQWEEIEVLILDEMHEDTRY